MPLLFTMARKPSLKPHRQSTTLSNSLKIIRCAQGPSRGCGRSPAMQRAPRPSCAPMPPIAPVTDPAIALLIVPVGDHPPAHGARPIRDGDPAGPRAPIMAPIGDPAMDGQRQQESLRLAFWPRVPRAPIPSRHRQTRPIAGFTPTKPIKPAIGHPAHPRLKRVRGLGGAPIAFFPSRDDAKGQQSSQDQSVD